MYYKRAFYNSDIVRGTNLNISNMRIMERVWS